MRATPSTKGDTSGHASTQEDASTTKRSFARLRTPAARARALVVLAIITTVALTVVLAAWDARREGREALSDFTREQTVLAQAVASDVGYRLARLSDELPPGIALADHVDPGPLLAGALHIQIPAARFVLIVPPRRAGLVAADGRVLVSPPIAAALEGQARDVELTRDEAESVGLPRRIAVAGLASVDGPRGSPWKVVVLASAERLRDREARASTRFVLGVAFVAAVIVGFGGLALGVQRRELVLAQQLVTSRLERERDRELVRAEKMATLAALSTGIAHEVSTPLGVISGRVEQLLGRCGDDERQKRALETVLAQVDRIHRVMRGFLGLARGDAPVLDRVVPASLVASAAALVRHRFEQAGVTLSVGAPHDLPPVSCDPPLFEQVLVNLLLNACDASRPGGVVRLSVEASVGAHVSFRVEDDGSGMSDEAMTRATEPFFTTKTDGRGSGLGLAIANEIVKHHGGAFRLARRERAETSGDHELAGEGAVHAASSSRGTLAEVILPTSSPSIARDTMSQGVRQGMAAG